MRTNVLIVVAITVFALCGGAVDSCTVFTAARGGRVFVGNNEDTIYSGNKPAVVDTKIWFLPASDGRLGRAFLGYYWEPYPEGGVNEKGLFFDIYAFAPPGQSLAPVDPGKRTYKGSLYELILEKCSTVDQALEYIRTYNDRGLGRYEVMFADREGKSAYVTWDWLTSSPRVTRKSEYFQAIGVGKDAVQTFLQSGNEELSDGLIRNLLNVAHLGDSLSNGAFTTYSYVLDLVNGDIWIYYLHDFEKAVQFNLTTELRKGPRLHDLYSLFPQSTYSEVESFFDKRQTPLQLAVLLILAVLWMSPFVLWPVTWILAVRSGVPAVNGLCRTRAAARAAALVTSVLGLFLLVYVTKYAPFIWRYGLGIFGPIVALLPVAMAVLTLAQAVLLVPIASRKLWSTALRVHYIALLSAAATGLGLLLDLDLIV